MHGLTWKRGSIDAVNLDLEIRRISSIIHLGPMSPMRSQESYKREAEGSVSGRRHSDTQRSS